MNIVSIGEILWDVFPDKEFLGGAPLNFSVHASRLGHSVRFFSAVGDDARGAAALARAAAAGLDTSSIQTVAGIPTGYVSVFVDSAGQPDFTIHRPVAYDALSLSPDLLDSLAAASPDWIYFGSLHQADDHSRDETLKLLAALPRARRFYDVNLRRNSYTPELVQELLGSADVVKINHEEAALVDAFAGVPHGTLEDFTARWSEILGWQAIAVTRGSDGCAIRIGSDYAEAPGYRVQVADTVGSGDAFAAAFLHGLYLGWDAARTGDFANRLGAVVASRAGAIPPWSLEDCRSLS